MAKDTKEIISQALLKISSENGKFTIEEISNRSYITRATIMKNFPNGIPEIIEYLGSQIIDNVNQELFKHDPDKLSLEQFADIILPILWENKDSAQIMYTTSLPFHPIPIATNSAWTWVENRYNRLVKVHNLSPYISGKELLVYWNSYLISVLMFWLLNDNPLEPKEFRPKFLFLMRTSLNDLIFKTKKSIQD
ncbi:MAG: TetR/AcrR family transcriptional regulator [Lactococcus lactis]|jgi:hypothetical protein|nr:TetR/AcrR family transcriptional regulator [Lactococcus lactis]